VTTVTRAYVSRLAGLPVFDPNGDRVGKVRDVVVALRVGTASPRVLGLVVEVVARRRIFVPMGRVTSVDPGAVVLGSGTLNLKRFEQRRGETLVLGELLDRTVRILENGRSAAVVDAGIEQTRTGDWVVTRLAVQEPGRLGRRGQLHQLEWSEVSGLALPESGQGTETLIATYRDLNAADLAHALQDLPIKRRHEVAEALDDERLADVLGSPRQSRSPSSARSPTAAPPTCSRRWTPTTRPTCWPSSRSSTATGCSSSWSPTRPSRCASCSSTPRTPPAG
jgi:sporulation protein YlmC with PRC-barrel domain